MVTCKGTTTDGDRCTIKHGLSHGFCRWHGTDNLCLGKCRDGVRCTAPRKPNYDYCSAAHDPRLYYVSPGLFGKEHLRAEKVGVVAEYHGGRDVYHDEKLEAHKLHEYEVDRILETQCFAFATVQAGITKKSDQEWVASFIRDKVANRTKNLCVTRKSTSVLKRQACSKFLDDYVTGHREHKDGLTLDMYLKKETSQDGEQLLRTTTLRMRKAMGKKVKFSQRKLLDEGDSPEFEHIASELQKMYVDMDLRVGSSANEHAHP